MRLQRVPRRPDSAPSIRITIGLRNAPESWRDYLYWNAELETQPWPEVERWQAAQIERAEGAERGDDLATKQG